MDRDGDSEADGFDLLWRDEPIGRVRERWWADGRYWSEIRLSDQGAQESAASRLDVRFRRGRWRIFEAHTPAGSIRLERRFFGLRTTIDGESSWSPSPRRGRPASFYAPALLFELVRAAGDGPLVVPIVTAVMGATRARVEPMGGPGADAARRWRVRWPGYDLVVAIAGGKVVAVEDEDRHLSLRRAASEARSAAAAAPAQSTTAVPMRDGVRLATELFLPAGPPPFPTVVLRTPYDRTLHTAEARRLARRGFAVAVQDVRGRFGSEGGWEPFVNEGRDGFDTVEWAAAQRWSNGKVGMIGGSYSGLAQWLCAAERPPHLAAVAPAAAPPDPFRNIPYENGAFALAFALWWNMVMEERATEDRSGRALLRAAARDLAAAGHLPVIDLDRKLLGRVCEPWRRWIEHPSDDAYWASVRYLDRIGPDAPPAFMQTGWFDGNLVGAPLAYARLADAAPENRRLVVGAWEHGGEARSALGEDFGRGALFDLNGAAEEWLRERLSGETPPASPRPPVALFVLGANRWIGAETYPPPGVRHERWRLANPGSVDGTLERGDAVAGGEPKRFLYDPAKPTLDLGLRAAGPIAAAQAVAYHRPLSGVRRQRDVAAYESRALDGPLTLVGSPVLELHASSTALDTDWHIHLIARAPRGPPALLTHGRLRARFRRSLSAPEPITPGLVEAYRIELWPVAVRLTRGTRLRLEVASAAFPTFSRNLNTGGHNEVEMHFIEAVQVIHHGKEHPSRLILPVLPPDELDRAMARAVEAGAPPHPGEG